MADQQLDQVSAKDTVLGVLNYVDSPFKLGVVVLLAVMTFCGYFIYANQSFLLAAYNKNKEQPKMDSSNFDKTARLVLKNTGCDLVAIFSVNQMMNTRTLLAMYDKDGSRIKEMDGTSVPIFSKNESNNQDSISLMSGKVTQGPYTSPQSALGFYYVGRGVTWMARAPAPVDVRYWVGQLSLGCKVKPQNDVAPVMEAAADMLMENK